MAHVAGSGLALALGSNPFKLVREWTRGRERRREGGAHAAARSRARALRHTDPARADVDLVTSGRHRDPRARKY